ncbi:hypothetical protein E4U54_004937, partial [Claviceps lovelessii]
MPAFKKTFNSTHGGKSTQGNAAMEPNDPHLSLYGQQLHVKIFESFMRAKPSTRSASTLTDIPLLATS